MLRYTSSFISLLLTVGLGASCSPAPEEAAETIETPPPLVVTALADLYPTRGSDASGTVTFEETAGRVKITALLTGLEPGLHGFHIHESGDCSAPDASSAGDHFNPGETEHGAPDSPIHHTGDLGNIEADADGQADFEMTVDFISLSEGLNSVLGKALIVDESADDFGQPTGKAGVRLACGGIVLKDVTKAQKHE